MENTEHPWRHRLPPHALKGVVYEMVAAATRGGEGLPTPLVYAGVERVMLHVGHRPVADAQVRQQLIWLRNDGMVTAREGVYGRRDRLHLLWTATDPSPLVEGTRRWDLVYRRGTSPYRLERPGWGSGVADEIETFPDDGLDVEDERDRLSRQGPVLTCFGVSRPVQRCSSGASANSQAR